MGRVANDVVQNNDGKSGFNIDDKNAIEIRACKKLENVNEKM
jgi:hypothetical protein